MYFFENKVSYVIKKLFSKENKNSFVIKSY